MSRIAITGGSGFIGSALAKHFSNHFNVRVIDIDNVQIKSDDQVEFVKCDVRQYEQVKRALRDVDLVIHTAVVQIPRITQEKRLGYEVNVVGTENVCEAVRESSASKGLILVGSWHTIGEGRTTGVVDEKFGFRPDLVEERARLYVLSKIAQECIVRFFHEDSQDKTYGVTRIGTTLGENMPKQTAASIFIDKGVKGEPLTPYEHSMYRPMLYVDVIDVCRAFESYAVKIIGGELDKTRGSLETIVNVYYPEPITILDLAEIVKESVARFSCGRVNPQIVIKKTGAPPFHTAEDKKTMELDITKALSWLGLKRLTHPKETIDRIVKNRLSSEQHA